MIFKRLSPFGTDFEKPLLEIDDNEVVDVRAIGKDKNHLKLVTGQLQLQSIFWKNGQLATQIEPGQPINLLEIYKSMNGTEINHHSLLFKI